MNPDEVADLFDNELVARKLTLSRETRGTCLSVIKAVLGKIAKADTPVHGTPVTPRVRQELDKIHENLSRAMKPGRSIAADKQGEPVGPRYLGDGESLCDLGTIMGVVRSFGVPSLLPDDPQFKATRSALPTNRAFIDAVKKALELRDFEAMDMAYQALQDNTILLFQMPAGGENVFADLLRDPTKGVIGKLDPPELGAGGPC